MTFAAQDLPSILATFAFAAIVLLVKRVQSRRARAAAAVLFFLIADGVAWSLRPFTPRHLLGPAVLDYMVNGRLQTRADAVALIIGSSGRRAKPHVRREALLWILHSDRGLFSFNDCCNWCGLDSAQGPRGAAGSIARSGMTNNMINNTVPITGTDEGELAMPEAVISQTFLDKLRADLLAADAFLEVKDGRLVEYGHIEDDVHSRIVANMKALTAHVESHGQFPSEEERLPQFKKFWR